MSFGVTGVTHFFYSLPVSLVVNSFEGLPPKMKSTNFGTPDDLICVVTTKEGFELQRVIGKPRMPVLKPNNAPRELVSDTRLADAKSKRTQ